MIKTENVSLKNQTEISADLVCFSHLRWNFVYQRPQHLLSRFTQNQRVFFIEEPEFSDQPDSLLVTQAQENLWVVVPKLNHQDHTNTINRQRELLDNFFRKMQIKEYIFWFYTPMALPLSEGRNPLLVIYDCMDELSAFKFAPPELKENEAKLLARADVVFTGGNSLYEAKKHTHHNIHPFPSSIDKKHFLSARTNNTTPADQANIPHPRLGFYGVVDERFDIDLIASVAKARPEWHFVLIGPIVKIDPATLPRYENIHYLGGKSYQELPTYLAGWDIAIIPFALNESTRFISPTKTPEYLAAGKPVISTSIRDVVNPYGKSALVHIADLPDEFIQAAELELNNVEKSNWLKQVDIFLEDNSWDNTWKKMMHLITAALKEKQFTKHSKTKEQVYV